MEKNQMKNIVVLKNLPSNLIEEAILIFKSNKQAKKYEFIDEKVQIKNNKNTKKDYIIKEAESVISNYINTIEKKKIKPIDKKKYKNLKAYCIIVTIAFIIACFI